MSRTKYLISSNHGELTEANWIEAAKTTEEMHKKLDMLINSGYTSMLITKIFIFVLCIHVI